MARSTQTVQPASKIGGALGVHGAIDAYAATDGLAVKRIKVGAPALTRNSTTLQYEGALGIPGFIVAAFLGAHVAPIASGGTLSVNVLISVGGAAATLLATLDPQTLTADIATAMTLQAANDTLVAAALDTLQVSAVADDHAIGTAEVGMVVTILYRPIEPLAAPQAGKSIITGTYVGL